MRAVVECPQVVLDLLSDILYKESVAINYKKAVL